MIATVGFETALALKAAGFPQPELEPGQFWYNEIGQLHIMIQARKAWDGGRCMHAFIVGTDRERLITKEIAEIIYSFAPNLEDITPHLPPVFALEMWGGSPSCTNRDDESPLRTFGDNFAESAAAMFLAKKM